MGRRISVGHREGGWVISAWPWPETYVLSHHATTCSTLGSLPWGWVGVGSEQEAGRGQRPGTDVVERAGQREREFDSKEMFLEGDKAPPASSGNCFV